MLFCGVVENLKGSTNLVSNCAVTSILVVRACIFNNLGNISVPGGAIYVNTPATSMRVHQSVFYGCQGNSGGAIYSATTESCDYERNCVSNCVSIDFGLAVNSHNRLISMYMCSAVSFQSSTGHSINIFKATSVTIKNCNGSQVTIASNNIYLIYDSHSVQVTLDSNTNSRYGNVFYEIQDDRTGDVSMSNLVNISVHSTTLAFIYNINSSYVLFKNLIFIDCSSPRLITHFPMNILESTFYSCDFHANFEGFTQVASKPSTLFINHLKLAPCDAEFPISPAFTKQTPPAFGDKLISLIVTYVIAE